MVELGESLVGGVIREVREETGLTVEAVELIELLDRIHREGERVRYHYVIADYLCRVTGGTLQAASDADAVRWVERAEWNSHSALKLDPITVRVIEAGWQRARALGLAGTRNDEADAEERFGSAGALWAVAIVAGAGILVAAGELLQRDVCMCGRLWRAWRADR